MEKHELQSASYELLVTGWKLKSTSWNSQLQIHEFSLVNPQVASLNLRVTKFIITSYLQLVYLNS